MEGELNKMDRNSAIAASLSGLANWVTKTASKPNTPPFTRILMERLAGKLLRNPFNVNFYLVFSSSVW